MEHTKTPWNIDATGLRIGTPVYSGDADEIAVMKTPYGKEAAQANAAFIVTACNAHEDLIAALKELLELGQGNCNPHVVASVAKEALRKAGIKQ